MSRKTTVCCFVCVLAVYAAMSWLQRPTAAANQAPVAVPGTYSVIDTDGTNLLVVDNAANVLYFYTVEPGKEVGDDLHLRGSLDLKDVGKPTLKPKKAAK